MIEFIANFLAWYVFLCMIILPIFGMVKMIKTISRKLKSRKLKVYNTPDEWKSDWTWNEETQLWEHPRSKKSEGEYSYRKEDIKTFETEHFHHTDTAFKSHPIPVAEEKKQEDIKVVIPENIQEIIQRNKQEKTARKTTQQKSKPRYYAPSGPRLIYTYQKAELKPQDREEENPDLDFENAYQSRELFTRNEWQNYKKLKAIADEKGLVVCPKVRLFDIIEPRLDKKRKLTYRYKIQAKHVDFVICNKDMKILAILELDDNSHYDPERIKRDDFINKILLSVGYTVIHTKYIEHDIFDMI